MAYRDNTYDVDEELAGIALMEKILEQKEERLLKTIRDDFESYRREFIWERNMNANNERLDKTEYLRLYEISDSHLESLIDWTDPVEKFYPPSVQLGFKKEKAYRASNNISVEDYE